MSIKDFRKKINNLVLNLDNDIVIILTIVLIAFGSFGLGRLSIVEENRVPVVIKNEAGVINSFDNKKIRENPSKGIVIASKNGTKYHYPWCSGGKRISERNKIQFNSIEEAKQAGYEPAGNCKGLR